MTSVRMVLDQEGLLGTSIVLGGLIRIPLRVCSYSDKF